MRNKHFPLWHRLVHGESVFVPHLDPENFRDEALADAQYVLKDLSVTAKLAVYQGLLGVMFTRRRLPQAAETLPHSEPPESA